MLPPRIERKRNIHAIKKAKRAKRIRSPGHLAWVRQHQCCVPGCLGVPIEAAHVRTGTNGGTSLKPDDSWVISLCATHHRIQHLEGEKHFENRFGIDMKALAQEFAAKSPHRMKLKGAA